MADLPFVNSILLIALTAGASFASAIFLSKRAARATADAQLMARVIELEKQLALVGAAVLPLNMAFQAVLIKELTHFHTPEMDGLMTKIGPPSALTEAEEARLAVLLEERERDMHDEISDGERDAAKMLPMVIKRTKAEAIAPVSALVLLQAVTLPADPRRDE